MMRLGIWAATAAIAALTGTAQAALVDRGGGMIYDTTRNITWLADMNYASTSGYAAANAGGSGSTQILSNGQMGWSAAVAWANNLVYGGYDDWRLPTLNPSDSSCDQTFDPFGFPLQHLGYNCTGGELSGLFVTELGNKAGESVLTQTGDTPEQIANLALFSNVQSLIYWSGTEYTPVPSDAWGFNTFDGGQFFDFKDFPLYAVAVRSGDVAAPVPEPQTLPLALLAFSAWVVASRRRPR